MSGRDNQLSGTDVAHGINNPLTAVIANLDTALRELEALDDRSAKHELITERLCDAREAACRIHRLVLEMARGVDGASFQSPTLPTQEAAELDAPARRGRVLVVDDERLITSAVKRLLSVQHDVTTVSRAEDALSAVRSGERFDVIVCDLMMPTMTGMELHAHFRLVAPDQATRMIFLTGGAFTQDARSFLATVPNARVEKPFDPRGLKALVDNCMR